MRAALFDLDDTLIVSYANPGPAWRQVAREFSGLFGDDTEAVGDALAQEMAVFLSDDENRRQWRLRAETTRRQAARDALVRHGFARFAGSAGDIADRYAAFREENMKLHPGALAVLDVYRDRGLKLGLVTNGATEVQRMKIERFGLAPRFEHIQIEEEAGFGKPDGRAYVTTLGALGVPAEAAQMVGDDLIWDVLAPQRLGMRAIWFNPYGNPPPPSALSVRPDATISSLLNLLPASPATALSHPA